MGPLITEFRHAFVSHIHFEKQVATRQDEDSVRLGVGAGVNELVILVLIGNPAGNFLLDGEGKRVQVHLVVQQNFRHFQVGRPLNFPFLLPFFVECVYGNIV